MTCDDILFHVSTTSDAQFWHDASPLLPPGLNDIVTPNASMQKGERIDDGNTVEHGDHFPDALDDQRLASLFAHTQAETQVTKVPSTSASVTPSSTLYSSPTKCMDVVTGVSIPHSGPLNHTRSMRQRPPSIFVTASIDVDNWRFVDNVGYSGVAVNHQTQTPSSPRSSYTRTPTTILRSPISSARALIGAPPSSTLLVPPFTSPSHRALHDSSARISRISSVPAGKSLHGSSMDRRCHSAPCDVTQNPLPSASPIASSWLTDKTYGVIPPFTRLGLNVPGVVLPLTVREYRQKQALKKDEKGHKDATCCVCEAYLRLDARDFAYRPSSRKGRNNLGGHTLGSGNTAETRGNAAGGTPGVLSQALVSQRRSHGFGTDDYANVATGEEIQLLQSTSVEVRACRSLSTMPSQLVHQMRPRSLAETNLNIAKKQGKSSIVMKIVSKLRSKSTAV